MSSLFPGGAAGGSSIPGEISRDQIIVIITQTQSQLIALEKSLNYQMESLKSSIEEMVQRLEADADEMKGKMSGIADLSNGHKSMDTRVSVLEKAVRDLVEWQIKEKQTIKTVGIITGGAGAVLGTLIAHFWKS